MNRTFNLGKERGPTHVTFNVKARESNVEEKQLLTSFGSDVNLEGNKIGFLFVLSTRHLYHYRNQLTSTQ